MSFVCVKDFQNYAFESLPRNALDYYRSGAGAQTTLNNNSKAFSKLRIRPRYLRNVANRDLSCTILDNSLSMPIGIAPTAMQRMAHPDGECATAKAAEEAGVIYTLSTIATTSIEEIAKVAPRCTKWFQLYIHNDREVTKHLVDRAQNADFKALVVTIDAPIFGLRLADERNKFILPAHLKLANFEGSNATIAAYNTRTTGSAMNSMSSLLDASLEWNDIKWLKSITKLPIVLKGILTAEDAILAADLGINAVWVSNHGARQIDGTPASIEALPEIVQAVGHRLDVYLDGGISDGTDVFKALALGAKMVFIGRPILWGLSHSGQQGVKKILDILKRELDVTMAISGCSSIEQIERRMVVHQSFYIKL